VIACACGAPPTSRTYGRQFADPLRTWQPTPLFLRGVTDVVWAFGGFFCWVVLFTGAMEVIGEAVWR
jgi:hypothetical protein